MSQPGSRASTLLLGGYLGASLIVALAAGAVAVRRADRAAATRVIPGEVAGLLPPNRPIPGEADVFRTNAGVLAIPAAGRRERDAHRRTLARFQLLRAYPGAPPRIPHGFTADEFRTGTCNTCHRRGGFSPRFDAYVPVTPHPDMPACLQCHVGRDEVTGVSLPDLDPSTVCRQCHAPGAARWADGLVDWRPMAWPSLARMPRNDGMPPIPHDSYFRGNCLTCHSGPSAVDEIRTRHPERADCRACHVAPDPGVGEYSRPGSTGSAAGKGS